MFLNLNVKDGLNLAATTAQATLFDRGNGMIYDQDLNITWLSDANYFKTQYTADNTILSTLIGQTVADSVYGSVTTTAADFNTATGQMTWWGAQAWAANLSFGGYDDWRLPTIVDTGTSGCNFSYNGTDCGYNAATATSELAYMYFNNLGLDAYFSTTGGYQSTWGIFGNGTLNGTDNSSYGQNNVGLVHNLQSYAYWSGSEYAPNPNNAWNFNTNNGNQNTNNGNQNTNNKNNPFYGWAVRSGE